MKLIKAKVSGYRRLAVECEIKLDTDPVCIVGPNAAGKSSFLDALVHLSSDDEFAFTERTRRPSGAALDPFVQARFVLEEDELALINGIPEATDVRQFFVQKKHGLGWKVVPEPMPRRNLSLREDMQASLNEFSEGEWIAGVMSIEPNLDTPPEPVTGDLLQVAIGVAESEQQNLGESVKAFDEFAARLRSITQEQMAEASARKAAEEAGEEPEPAGHSWPALPEEFASLETQLLDLSAHEQQQHPRDQVITALEEWVPDFLKFDELARELKTDYNLAEEPDSAGAAIHNFLTLGDTSWTEALEVVSSGDKGRKKAYLEKVNQLLEARAAVVWEQSEIKVGIDLDGTILTILLSMQEDDYIDFEQHSDGLRQFIALRSFIASAAQKVKPIVMIDEAETHLHYDAQADLVAVFEEQNEAAKIIYTTHSAGCLPRDLGLGIRAIVPDRDPQTGTQGDHSHVINKFWTEGRGYSPLLLAMGAGALAFSATQRAVVTEGMSDALLLPSLIREATGKERLPYQAAPSFAEANPEQIRDLDLIAARIAFLADGDEGGRTHVERLTDNGILEEQIRYLGGAEDSGLAIEDLLDGEIYLKAVNKELDAWHQLEYPEDQLPATGRSQAVKQWCEAKSDEVGKKIKISKVDVAQRVLDQRGDETALLDEKYRPTLVQLDAELETIFDDAPERVTRLKDALDAATQASSS